MNRAIKRLIQLLVYAAFWLHFGPRSALRAQEYQSQTASAAGPDAATPVADQISAVPNRPTFSTTAESVQPGVFEVEYGFELAEGHQNINGLLKFGATRNLELRFANNPFERDLGIAGTGDSGAGFKYKFFTQRRWRPTFSLLYGALIPTARAGLGVGAVSHSAGILASKDYGPHHLDFNETVQWVGRPDASGFDRNYFTALAYSHAIHGRWGMTAEIAGFSWTNTISPATMTLMGSAIYTVSPRLVVDGGVYVAAYGHLPRNTLFCGITYSIADLYHRRRGKAKRSHSG
jgi:hypothetical protein